MIYTVVVPVCSQHFCVCVKACLDLRLIPRVNYVLLCSQSVPLRLLLLHKACLCMMMMIIWPRRKQTSGKDQVQCRSVCVCALVKKSRFSSLPSGWENDIYCFPYSPP